MLSALAEVKRQAMFGRIENNGENAYLQAFNVSCAFSALVNQLKEAGEAIADFEKFDVEMIKTAT